METVYRVFTRTWWKSNPNWPNGLEPSPGRRTVIRRNIVGETAAQDFCRVWNSNHEPGRLSRKAEYETQP